MSFCLGYNTRHRVPLKPNEKVVGCLRDNHATVWHLAWQISVSHRVPSWWTCYSRCLWLFPCFLLLGLHSCGCWPLIRCRPHTALCFTSAILQGQLITRFFSRNFYASQSEVRALSLTLHNHSLHSKCFTWHQLHMGLVTPRSIRRRSSNLCPQQGRWHREHSKVAVGLCIIWCFETDSCYADQAALEL